MPVQTVSTTTNVQVFTAPGDTYIIPVGIYVATTGTSVLGNFGGTYDIAGSIFGGA